MDESLKARLIGATVLVVVAVLLVPELLSGRKAGGPAVEDSGSTPGTRTFTIELGAAGSGGAESSPARPAAAPVSASRSPPVPPPSGTESPESDTVSPATAPAASTASPPAAATSQAGDPGRRVVAAIPGSGPAADPDAAPATTVPPPGASGSASTKAGGGWAVQVGAFGSAESADRVVRELGAAGFAARVAPVTRDGHTLHRVRVGHESDKAAAERLAQELQARGMQGTVVADD